MRTVALVLAITLVLMGGSAVAQSGPIGLSLDGQTWSPSLPHPMFSPAFRWVPGDSRTSMLYVRNQSGQQAILNIALVARGLSDPALARDFLVTTSVDGQKAVAEHPPTSAVNVSVGPAAVGSVHLVKLVVSMAPSAKDQSQARRLAFDVRVTLSQAPTAAGGHTSPAGRGDGSHGLPDTGGPLTPALLVTITALIATGLGLMRRARSS